MVEFIRRGVLPDIKQSEAEAFETRLLDHIPQGGA